MAWSNNDFLVVMQYFEKKTSRALVFAASSSVEPVLLYAAGLIQRVVDVELRPTLRENDHVFVEGSRLEEKTPYFRVWGYGKQDPNGLSWSCRYSPSEGSVWCAQVN